MTSYCRYQSWTPGFSLYSSLFFRLPLVPCPIKELVNHWVLLILSPKCSSHLVPFFVHLLLPWKWKWSRSVVSDSFDPMDCSPPGSSVYGIFQARILECHIILQGIFQTCIIPPPPPPPPKTEGVLTVYHVKPVFIPDNFPCSEICYAGY